MISINLISPRAPFFSTLPRYLLSDINSGRSVGFSTFPIPASQSRPTSPGLQVVSGDVSGTSAGVLAYLAKQELRALDPWELDDLRISWLCVLRASEGHSDPWRYAFWCYFGAVPEKLIPYFVARDQAHHTEGFPASLLPFKYTTNWQEEFQRGMDIASLPPKKPAASVPLTGVLRRIA